ncbi:MAG: S49 family peptidase [Parachlamydiaceae bacterium]|nr:S49 family peptidase [Parachlamydiaceae bacterium]
MRDSIFYSALRALFVAFCVIIGLFLGIIAITMGLGALSSDTESAKLTTVNTEEILPNAEGKRKVVSSDAPVILQINIDGVIGTELLNTDTIQQILVESREGDFKNDRVKGILLNINSPGGTVIDSDGILHNLLAYKKRYNVPIYAYTNGLCASGGMYVALAADKIYSSDVSLIGSIGVLLPTFMNFTKLLEKIGVETLTITAGKEKDALNPLRPWKPGEDENYRNINEYYYDAFVNLVTTHRPQISKEKLINDYGARIFPAALAQEYGYIDVSGVTLSEALKALLEKLEITDDKYQVIRLENKGWWKTLFSSQSSLLTGTVKHQITISPEIDLMLRNQFLYLYCPQ